MRWGYLIPRVVIVAGVWAFFAFAFDPLLRWSLIAGGQAGVGAKVEVAGLDTGFFPPRFELTNVAVANPSAPMTNVVEFESMRFHVWGRPLLKRKIIIDEASLTGLEWGTPRETSGELPYVEPSESGGGFDFGLGGLTESLQTHALELGDQWLLDLENRVRAELDPSQLGSLKLVRDLEADWKLRFDGLETRLKDIERRVNMLKDGIDKAGRSPLERIEAYQRAAVEVRDLLDEAKTIRGELNGLVQRARADFAVVEETRKRDLATIRSKAELLTMDGDEITETLLGPTITEKLEQANAWLAFVQRYASALAASVQPTRLRGLDVAFPRPEDDLPNFLIEEMKLTGTLPLGGEPLPFAGVVTGITSEPAYHDAPIVFRAEAVGDSTIRLSATIDLREETPIYDVIVDYDQPLPLDSEFGNEKLAIAVHAAKTRARAHIRLVGETIKGHVKLQQSPVRIDPAIGEGVDPKVARIVASTLSGLQAVDAQLDVAGRARKPSWKLQSNLGPAVAGGLRSFLSDELDAQREKLVAKANTLVDSRMAEFRDQLNGRFGDVVEQLELDESKAQQLIQRIAGGKLDPSRLKNPLDLLRRR